MGFRFIHISDHHLLESERGLRLGFSPAYAFRKVMRHIAVHSAQQVDFILSTGDAVDPPSELGYRNFLKMLGCVSPSGRAPGPLRISLEGLHEMPFYLLPGNHDHRERFLKEIFPETHPAAWINSVFHHQGVKFICLDWGPGSKAAASKETLAFLRGALDESTPSVLAMHHHPIPTGFRWMDAFLADGIDLFWEEIRGYPILGLLFGHTHQSYEHEHNGVTGYGVRSTSYSFAPMDEPYACLLPPHYRIISVGVEKLETELVEVPI
jgi:Icc protein